MSNYTVMGTLRFAISIIYQKILIISIGATKIDYAP